MNGLQMSLSCCLMSHCPSRYRDHELAGQWKGCQECHLAPDLLLIYRKRAAYEKDEVEWRWH
jgi:addiction module RelE/StbE family toxin